MQFSAPLTNSLAPSSSKHPVRRPAHHHPGNRFAGEFCDQRPRVCRVDAIVYSLDESSSEDFEILKVSVAPAQATLRLAKMKSKKKKRKSSSASARSGCYVFELADRPAVPREAFTAEYDREWNDGDRSLIPRRRASSGILRTLHGEPEHLAPFRDFRESRLVS